MSLTIDGLRAATRDIHARLHLSPAFAPLMQTPPDGPGYLTLLRQLRGFHQPIEHRLFAAAEALVPEIDDLARRRKAHLLDADIKVLSEHFPNRPPVGEIEPPAAVSRAGILGGLYVIEGATLGGRELGRALEPLLQPLGLRGHDGRRFFLAYDPNQGPMWRQFCAGLEAATANFSAVEQTALQDAARAMFLTLESWLSENV